MKFRIVFTVVWPANDNPRSIEEVIRDFRCVEEEPGEYLYGCNCSNIKAVLEVSKDGGVTWEVVPT